MVGVAVLLKAGNPNATIQQIWDHMRKTESKVLSGVSTSRCAQGVYKIVHR